MNHDIEHLFFLKGGTRLTWEILAGLITIAGALGGFAKTIANNTRAMTELRCTVSALNAASKEQHSALEAIREEVVVLHTRIAALETKLHTENGKEVVMHDRQNAARH